MGVAGVFLGDFEGWGVGVVGCCFEGEFLLKRREGIGFGEVGLSSGLF